MFKQIIAATPWESDDSWLELSARWIEQSLSFWKVALEHLFLNDVPETLSIYCFPGLTAATAELIKVSRKGAANIICWTELNYRLEDFWQKLDDILLVGKSAIIITDDLYNASRIGYNLDHRTHSEKWWYDVSVPAEQGLKFFMTEKVRSPIS